MDPYFVPSRACPAVDSHEVFIFNEKEKTLKTAKNKKKSEKESEEAIEEVDMKKARFEVYKFAQSGLSNPEKQKSEFELALKLGAIPEKNKAINYKKLKEERLKMRKEEIQKNQLHSFEKNFKIKSKRNKDPKSQLRKKRKIGSGLLNIYGKVKKSMLHN